MGTFEGRRGLSAGLLPAPPHRLHHAADLFRVLAAFRLHRAADIQAVGAAVLGLVYIFQGNASGQKKWFTKRRDQVPVKYPAAAAVLTLGVGVQQQVFAGQLFRPENVVAAKMCIRDRGKDDQVFMGDLEVELDGCTSCGMGGNLFEGLDAEADNEDA